VLTAVLEASAELGRPLSATTVARLVNIIQRHGGWKLARTRELFYLLTKELGVLALIQNRGDAEIVGGTPVIVVYKTKEGDAHAEFGHVPLGDDAMRHVYALFILRAK